MYNHLAMLCLLFFGIFCYGQKSQADLQKLFEKGFFRQTAERDPKTAIKIYKIVLAQKPQDPYLAAMAHYHLAQCLEKQDKKLAQKTYRKITKLYSKDIKWVKKAQQKLDKPLLNDPKKILEALQREIMTIDVVDIKVEETIDALRQKTGANFVLSSLYFQQNHKLSLSVRKVSIYNILKIIARITEGDFAIVKSAVVFGTKEEVAKFNKYTWADSEILPLWAYKTQQQLKKRLISIDVVKKPFLDIVYGLQEHAKANIVVISKRNFAPITLKLRRVAILDTLRLLCFYYGNITYFYAENVLYISSTKKYQSFRKKRSKSLHSVKFHIKYEIEPEVKRVQVYLKNKKSGEEYVFPLKKEIKVFSGDYQMEVKEPGFAPVVVEHLAVKANIAPIYLKMQANLRPLSFDMYDEKIGKLVPAQEILVNGKVVSFRDKFKPGTSLQVKIRFKKYQTYQGQFTVTPGKGPFILHIPINELPRKKR